MPLPDSVTDSQDSRRRAKVRASAAGVVATLEEHLEVNAGARDLLVKYRADRSATEADRLAVDRALGFMSTADRSIRNALRYTLTAGGVA